MPASRIKSAAQSPLVTWSSPLKSLLARLPVRRLVVVELDVRLGVQRNEEVECKISVGAPRECEDRPPVVQLALQRDGLAGELPRIEVVGRAPLRRPLRRDVEAHLRRQVFACRLSDEWCTRRDSPDWNRAHRVCLLLQHARVVLERDTCVNRAKPARILVHNPSANRRALPHLREGKRSLPALRLRESVLLVTNG